MTLRRYHLKLVRDLTPRIIEENGDKCEVRQPTDSQERMKLLIDKLVEEAHELQAEFERNGEVSPAEFADVSDVRQRIESLLVGPELFKFEHARQVKNNTRGGFDKDVILVWTEEIKSGQCEVCFKGTQRKSPISSRWRCLECEEPV